MGGGTAKPAPGAESAKKKGECSSPLCETRTARNAYRNKQSPDLTSQLGWLNCLVFRPNTCLRQLSTRMGDLLMRLMLHVCIRHPRILGDPGRTHFALAGKIPKMFFSQLCGLSKKLVRNPRGGFWSSPSGTDSRDFGEKGTCTERYHVSKFNKTSLLRTLAG
jgi:hypothetical protein